MIQKMRSILTAGEQEITDEAALEIIEHYILQNKKLAMLSPKESQELVNRVFYSLRRDLEILQPYLEDERISEIMVNGKDHIFIETGGQLKRVDLSFDTTEDLEELIRRLAADVHREINELNPIVDARLEDGSRVNAVYKNIALNGPILTIRKFPQKAINMEALIEMKSITEEAADFLQKLVQSGYNCFISGGTSSGKTTFLNVLSNFIPSDERVILIEDSAELQIKQIDNLVRMECKQANAQQKGSVTMEALIKASLRMRPDRIIVGEVRGKEVMDMIQAMNTGHDGSLSTGHGNSISGMLRRLESMFLQAADFPIDAIRAQIAEGIDMIIHLGRLSDGSRRVLAISEIEGVFGGEIKTNPLFKYRPGDGLVRCGELIHTEKLELRGVSL
ncbi:MAG: CpaF family protein [Firmicutes bacterium]|nr:CpaF family protein [Bacillota bacterium]